MKYSLLLITIIAFTLSSCQSEITCEQMVLNPVNANNLYSDSTQAILLDCGKLDAVDMEITKTPLFTEIVNFEEFSNGKYDIKRFLADFQRFSKTDKYASLKNTLMMQTKTYNASDWAADKEILIRQYSLSSDDVEMLEAIVKNPSNASMKYPEAYQEMNKVKIQKMMDDIKKKNSEKK